MQPVTVTLSVEVTSLDTTFAGWSGDADCADGFYCQLEVEPQVCLAGEPNLPPVANEPPIIQSALVVTALGQSATGTVVVFDIGSVSRG